MKWGRKRLAAESSSSRHSLISHVFPVSWLSKFKQKSRDVEPKPVKVKQEVRRSSAYVGSAKPSSARGGRFYGGEGDDFWRLSFGEEGVCRKSSRGDPSSVWYDSDDKLDVPPTVCQSCGSNAATLMGNEEIDKFNNLILDVRKMRGLPRNVETLPEMDIFKVQQAVTKTKRVTTEKERKLKKMNRRVSEEKCPKLERYANEAEEKSRKSVEKDSPQFDPLGTNPRMEREIHNLVNADLKKRQYVSSTNSRNSNLTTVEEDGVFAVQNLKGNYGISAEKMSLEWERLKEMKIKELKSKSENQRKSLYIRQGITGQKNKTEQQTQGWLPKNKGS
ncbi:transcription repressor OFP5 [Melia azedarach]|uniref:Transcription repressor OFP5 n=1 Tax=Melia azedarach TaxID=155640 RepID=A0ACC1WXT5_MELAZ|nr:transcription repressor OFP5 [Melia azedarach]